ncbi:hypothetical protein M8C21_008062, partial [Ambrosia artemisiifolia]
TDMALRAFTAPLQFKNCDLFGSGSLSIPMTQIVYTKPWVIESRARTRVESPKVRNRRLQKKYNGTQKKPRLSEAAQRVGEELVKTCADLGIDEISSYDRNGFSRGARKEAFEIALSCHGFLFR